MNNVYPTEIERSLSIVDFQIRKPNVSTLKIDLEKALTCIKRCSKRNKKKLPCSNSDSFHYTDCETFLSTIICIKNITSEILSDTNSMCANLGTGQVSISEFEHAAKKMLEGIGMIDINCSDEEQQRILHNELRNIREALNKTPVDMVHLFLQF